MILLEIKEEGLDYRAMSLVYTSLLALIPLLAVSFSVLKAFGADRYLEPFLLEILQPLGDKTVAARILDSVRHLEVGVLGFVGFMTLLYTSVSLLAKVEESFNHIWRRPSARSLMRRFGDYLSFILIGPLLVFSAFAEMIGLFDRGGLLSLVSPIFLALLPYLFIVAAFAFVYRFLPNATVKTDAAILGGLCAGLLWKAAGWIFGAFVSGSTQYPAVYSSFAILVLFMIWLYVSWLIVLFGMQVCFYYQNPRHLNWRRGRIRLRGAVFERAGLLIMLLIGRRFYRGEAPWTEAELADCLALPEDCLEELLQLLRTQGLLMAQEGEERVYTPARDLAAIRLTEVFSALRSTLQDHNLPNVAHLTDPAVDGIMDRLESAAREVQGKNSILDLIMEHEPG
ncbi:MAG: YhjD/YihY/BrkB family envelope integrity protein [Methylococcaceae bacterium]|nr:YhjD/YihY/BrkB family envelope integrity protein [Methylococcaceae bacterium]